MSASLRTKSKEKIFSVGILFVCSLAIAWYIGEMQLISILFASQLNPTFVPLTPKYLLAAALLALGMWVALVFVCSNKARSVRSFILNHRWHLGIVVIVLSCLLELNGSSLGVWNIYINTGQTPTHDVLFGIPRSIRSDEWLVLTPSIASQYHANFDVISPLLRGGNTVTSLVYGLPSFSLFTLFRPFMIPYLFLDFSHATSLFWTARLIILFLVSYEFAARVLKGRSLISLVYAALLTWSSIIQWFFAINGIVELFVSAQMLVILLHYLVRSEHIKNKIFLSLGMAYFFCMFVLVLYPAWQVPLIYIYLACGVGDVLTPDDSNLQERPLELIKQRLNMTTVLCILGSLVLTAALLAVMILPHFDVISLISNTVYPGHREDFGGDDPAYEPYALIGLTNPLNEAHAPYNAAESTGIFALSPLGLVLGLIYSAIRIKRAKRVDPTLITLSVVYALLALYVYIGLPAALARVLLLSRTIPLRVLQFTGAIDLILYVKLDYLMRTRDYLLSQTRTADKTLLYAAGLFIGGATLLYAYTSTNLPLQLYCYLGLCVIFSLLVIASILNAVPQTYILAPLFALTLSGMVVNPLHRGVSPLTDTSLAQTVHEISANNSSALWASDSFISAQYIVASGGSCINSTNTYPNLALWNKLDPRGTYSIVYNRYAHIDVVLKKGGNPGFLFAGSGDHFRVTLTASDLKTLGVTYYVTGDATLEKLSTSSTHVTLLETVNGLNIYRID